MAELLGTRQSNVSAYESGALKPGRLIGERIAPFLALAPDSAFSTSAIKTLPAYAVAIKKLLQDGGDPLRHIIQISDDFSALTDPADQWFFLTEPATVSDSHYDALLAGLAVHLCRQAGLPATPVWTTRPNRYASDIWFYGSARSIPKLRAAAWRDAIPSMRARGIVFSRRNLESV